MFLQYLFIKKEEHYMRSSFLWFYFILDSISMLSASVASFLRSRCHDARLEARMVSFSTCGNSKRGET